MSVPVLLTVLDNAPPVVPPMTVSTNSALDLVGAKNLLLEDDHRKNCASYVDVVAAAAAASVNSFTTSNFAKIETAEGVGATTQAMMLDAVKALEETTQVSVAHSAADETAAVVEPSPSPSLRCFTVQLDFDLEPHELLGLTGEAQALGEWHLNSCVPLSPQTNTNRRIWSATVLLQSPTGQTSYRYFIYTEDSQGRKQIRRWETHLKPRSLMLSTSSDKKNCPPNLVVVVADRFGVIESKNSTEVHTSDEVCGSVGAAEVKRGWLTFESIVQFKFEREHMFHVLDAEKFDAEHIQIKFEPLVAEEAERVGIHIDVAKLDYGQSHLRKQPATGAIYKRGDVLIFHLTVVDLTSHKYRMYFYRPDGELVGMALIKPEMLKGSEGELKLDIQEAAAKQTPSSSSVIAQLNLPYVIVRPYEKAHLLDFRTTYAHYWPKSWPNLDVGHRGNGRSFIADPPAECENTLASFMRAYESHADMIELDVHLTADGVPIIYHDFSLRTAPEGKEITSPDQLEPVLIKDVDYESLKQMRIFAVINQKPVEYPAHNAEPRFEHRIFPRLRDVLDGLPKSLGIDVEIKWPQRIACGGVEADQSIDKNFFVDRVLDTIIHHACGRPLIFSSFDADICTMLRFKQNIFPVMFLSMGETKKWRPFMDLRTRNFTQAINNAQAFELAGTAPHAEDFLGDHGPALMQKAVQAGQIAIVWGDDCNSKERVKYFSAIGATAICYDRADLYMPEHKERSFFNSSNLLAEFETQHRHCKTET